MTETYKEKVLRLLKEKREWEDVKKFKFPSEV